MFRLPLIMSFIILLPLGCSDSSDGIDPNTFALTVSSQPCENLTFLTDNGSSFRVQTSSIVPEIELVERQECIPMNENDPVTYCGDTLLGSINLTSADSIITSSEIRDAVSGNEYNYFHWRVRLANDIFFYSAARYDSRDLFCSGCSLLPEMPSYVLPNEAACSTASAEPFRDILTELYTYVGTATENLSFLACDRNRLQQEQSSIPADLSAYDGLLIFNRPASDTIQVDGSKPFVLATFMDNEGGKNPVTSVMPDTLRSNIFVSHINRNSGGSNVNYPNLIPGDMAYLRACSSGGSNFTVSGQSVRSNTLYTVPTP